jgi:hypothetical protein
MHGDELIYPQDMTLAEDQVAVLEKSLESWGFRANDRLERRLRLDLNSGVGLEQVRGELRAGGPLVPETGLVVGSIAAIVPRPHLKQWADAVPPELREEVETIAGARSGSIPLIVAQWTDIKPARTEGRPGKLSFDSDFPGAYRAMRSNAVISGALRVGLGLAKGWSAQAIAEDVLVGMVQYAPGARVMRESVPPKVYTLEQLGQILIPASRTLAATHLTEECRCIPFEDRNRRHVATVREFAQKELADAREEMWTIARAFTDPTPEVKGPSAAD